MILCVSFFILIVQHYLKKVPCPDWLMIC